MWIIYIIYHNENKICLIFILIISFIEKSLCLQLFSTQIYIFIYITYNKIFLYYSINTWNVNILMNFGENYYYYNIII